MLFVAMRAAADLLLSIAVGARAFITRAR